MAWLLEPDQLMKTSIRLCSKQLKLAAPSRPEHCSPRIHDSRILDIWLPRYVVSWTLHMTMVSQCVELISKFGQCTKE
jgi:hypothetical protein